MFISFSGLGKFPSIIYLNILFEFGAYNNFVSPPPPRPIKPDVWSSEHMLAFLDIVIMSMCFSFQVPKALFAFILSIIPEIHPSAWSCPLIPLSAAFSNLVYWLFLLGAFSKPQFPCWNFPSCLFYFPSNLLNFLSTSANLLSRCLTDCFPSFIYPF